MPVEEFQGFNFAVYLKTQQIPRGKVTTYGYIAQSLDHPNHSRHVGQALKNLSSNPLEEFNINNVPWWRVINAKGEISLRSNNNMYLQEDLLRNEGVELIDGKVNLSKDGWFLNDVY